MPLAIAFRVVVALCVALFIVSLTQTRARAQEARFSFSHAGVASDAKRYETYLKANWQPKGGARELKAEGDRVLAAGNDPRAAARAYAQAVVADSNDVDSWTGLSRALLAIKPDQGSERYELPVNASGAALTAYERAQTPAAKAVALVVLHEALKRRSYWRPAIDALKASLTLVEDAQVREAYDALVAEHGFRILEYKVEAEAALPRLCIQFSERLASGQIDWAQYFKMDGKDPQSITAEARQICIDGLAHGKRYEVQVREGLPSAVGEKLAKTAELAVYVKDRAPSVRATGRGYVLPNRGQQGIPLVTVNTDKVSVEVYRIGDRSLAQTLQSGDFAKQISSYDITALKERTGAKVYAGELTVATRLNEDVTTAFPIAEAIPKLQPGVYVLAAYASTKKEDDGYRDAATQWFVVSDLGLTAINGDDGMHAFVRSLAGATPVVNANVRLIARNNEVLATGKTDSRGYARFDAGLKSGEGGLAPAVLVAETGDGDYAFLDLSTGAFDLTDRGVKGRNPPGPIDAFAYTDRGVYRAGEQVYLTALARDRTGKASGLPITVIFSRPDGVEHSRTTLTDQGQGGRSMTLALAGSAMTGTWRAKIHTDPKSAAIAQASFLVEDFVPERLDLKLEPAVQALSPQEPGTIKLAGRYLYGPPAGGLAIEGEIAVRLAKGDLPGFAGYKFGLADEQVAPVRKPLEGLPVTDAEGKADIAVQLPALPKTSRPLEADVILKLRESGGRTIERTITLPVDLKSPRIGIKPLFKGGQSEEGEPARFEAIVVGADGKAADAKGLKWELMRLENRWQWYSRDGSWNFESQTSSRRIATGTVDAAAGTPAKIEAKVDWGRYRLEVSTTDGTGLDHLQHGVQRRLLRRRGRRQPRGARRRPRQAVLQGGRDGARQDFLAHGRPRPHRRDELGSHQHAGGRSAGRRRRGADPRQRRLEPRRLRHRAALPAHGREGQAHALARARPAVARHRPGAAHAECAPRRAREGEVRVRPGGAHQGRGPDGRRGGAHHGCGHRHRHPQPHPLRAAQAAGLVLRPAPARHRDPRRLRPPDRRHARGTRRAALRRRRLGRRHGRAGQPAGGGDARAVLRHRQSRRRRHRASRVPDARLQRHRAPLGGRLERRQGRLRHQGRDRARSGGADRVGPALPHAGRQGTPGAGAAQRGRRSGHLHRHRQV